MSSVCIIWKSISMLTEASPFIQLVEFIWIKVMLRLSLLLTLMLCCRCLKFILLNGQPKSTMSSIFLHDSCSIGQNTTEKMMRKSQTCIQIHTDKQSHPPQRIPSFFFSLYGILGPYLSHSMYIDLVKHASIFQWTRKFIRNFYVLSALVDSYREISIFNSSVFQAHHPILI